MIKIKDRRQYFEFIKSLPINQKVLNNRKKTINADCSNTTNITNSINNSLNNKKCKSKICSYTKNKKMLL